MAVQVAAYNVIGSGWESKCIEVLNAIIVSRVSDGWHIYVVNTDSCFGAVEANAQGVCGGVVGGSDARVENLMLNSLTNKRHNSTATNYVVDASSYCSILSVDGVVLKSK